MQSPTFKCLLAHVGREDIIINFCHVAIVTCTWLQFEHNSIKYTYIDFCMAIELLVSMAALHIDLSATTY